MKDEKLQNSVTFDDEKPKKPSMRDEGIDIQQELRSIHQEPSRKSIRDEGLSPWTNSSLYEKVI